MLSSGRLLDDVERLTVPTDVVVGAEDLVTPPEGARRVHECLRHPWKGSLVEIPQAGHAITQEFPDRIARLLAAQPEPVQ